MSKKKSNTLSTLSLVFGIIGLVMSCVLIGIIPSILGLILGIIALTKNQSKGMAIGGVVCGTIGILLALCMLFYYISTSDETSTYNTSTFSQVTVNGSEYQTPANTDLQSSYNIWADSFTPINDFRYTLDKTSNTITLIRYKGDDTKILLSPIYTIGGVDYILSSMGDEACFLSETHITSVYIPEGVTFIGASCFNSCASLKYIYLPSTLEYIPSTFWGYIGDCTVYCNSVSSLPSSRDTNNYAEIVDNTTEAEELGEDFARAINGMLGGVNDDGSEKVVEIYFGGTDEQWSNLTGNN